MSTSSGSAWSAGAEEAVVVAAAGAGVGTEGESVAVVVAVAGSGSVVLMSAAILLLSTLELSLTSWKTTSKTSDLVQSRGATSLDLGFSSLLAQTRLLGRSLCGGIFGALCRIGHDGGICGSSWRGAELVVEMWRAMMWYVLLGGGGSFSGTR